MSGLSNNILLTKYNLKELAYQSMRNLIDYGDYIGRFEYQYAISICIDESGNINNDYLIKSIESVIQLTKNISLVNIVLFDEVEKFRGLEDAVSKCQDNLSIDIETITVDKLESLLGMDYEIH